MNSRRDFLKKATLLAAGGGMIGGFPASVRKAFAIDPAPGSTWLDAEHVVILMQENRSFDHCFGALRGVRGFNDPRAVTLPNGNPVWLQSNRKGETYAPFRLDIKDTKATWMSSLPHSWESQTDARNHGRHDGWIEAKRSGNKEYADMPLTMGHYDRRDLPFYYALADAFTICDQNFCSSLTPTIPNRLHLWTGTVRERPDRGVPAIVRNEDIYYDCEASWTTFPERLEEAGISWRIYQNEISLKSGLTGEHDRWLGNYEDSPLEWFKQYRVRFAKSHRQHIARREKVLPGEIAVLEKKPASAARDKQLAAARSELDAIKRERAIYTEAAFAGLSARDRNLHDRAFTINDEDPQFRELASLSYDDGGIERSMDVPRGDVLHQFRKDVDSGNLPTVSWIISPENFSDHPSAPWYGAWYVSECLDILTKNPDVWRKTIFVLCYDENDGYFDHVPPFVPPHPDKPDTGKVSVGIDPSVEYVYMAHEKARANKHPDTEKREGPIGLGFRVPLVIASPWSRGGFVNSEVCDHTSILRMLETLLSHRTGKAVREHNISAWRRAVCGDLSSAFRPDDGTRQVLPKPVDYRPFMKSIHQAQFRKLPDDFRRLTSAEIESVRRHPHSVGWMAKQEVGVRPSCALPYELSVDGRLDAAADSLEISFAAARGRFGRRAAGAPFHVYSASPYRVQNGMGNSFAPGRTWAYAVAAGDKLLDRWKLADFENGIYHLRVHGPNGFHREFRGTGKDPNLELRLDPSDTGAIQLVNHGRQVLTVEIRDLSYGGAARRVNVGTGDQPHILKLETEKSSGWYDVGLKIDGFPEFSRRYAGRIESGKHGISDPAMGRIVV